MLSKKGVKPRYKAEFKNINHSNFPRVMTLEPYYSAFETDDFPLV